MNELLYIVDDDRELTELLSSYLSSHQFNVRVFLDPLSALSALEEESPQALILDVMLPEMDGFSLCREIRKRWSLPILMLTARGDVHDRIVGLEIGADDYMPKPFEPRELVARLRSILRRGSSEETQSFEQISDLTVDWDGRRVYKEGSEIALTTNEFELFSALVKSRGRVLDRGQLIERLRGIDWDASNRSIDMVVSRIRQKLGDSARSPRYIKTVTAVGYLFISGGS